ncbi:hypothetical protein Gpo141_00007531 [Globisporangium polare]
MASYFQVAREKLPNGTKYVVAGAVVGAAAIPLAGMAAGATVPWAMSAFGTVVPGVGTMHAAGGVAATLQWASTAFTGGAVVCGAVAGAATVTTANAATSGSQASETTVCEDQPRWKL